MMFSFPKTMSFFCAAFNQWKRNHSQADFSDLEEITFPSGLTTELACSAIAKGRAQSSQLQLDS